MPSRVVPGRWEVRYKRQHIFGLRFLMKAERHGPAVKIVQEGLKVPTDREVFGSLARPSCLCANRFMNKIHDINGVIELGDVRWHGALPSAHTGERRRRIRRRRAGLPLAEQSAYRDWRGAEGET